MHHIEEISSPSSDRISVQVRWNDARLLVNVNISPPSAAIPPIENTFIERYNAASNAEDDEEADALSDDILDAIVQVGRPIFDQLAPPPAPNMATSPDLHMLLFPKEYTFRFLTLDGKAELIRNNSDNSDITYSKASLATLSHPFDLRIDKGCCNLPRFSTKDIRVHEDLFGSGYIARVVVEGQEMCSKAGEGKGLEAAQRELDCLWKITASKTTATLRVPKLLGLIETPDDRRVIGYLEEYVPTSDAWELSTLGCIETVGAIAKERRKKWASQVQETVHLLHQIGITWGDGKASNVLIHRHSDDAWIIDFGGGWTDGWLDEELAGTVEGDQLAVKKIFELLEV